MSYDYGTVFGINGTDPTNSRVFLSWLPTGTACKSTVVDTPQRGFYENVNVGTPVFYLSDTYPEREFASIYSSQLYIYHVDLGNGTGTASINLVNTFPVSPDIGNNPDSSYFELSNVYGIRKMTDGLYYIYFTLRTGVSNDNNDTIVDFKRCASSSGDYTDTTLLTVTINKAATPLVDFVTETSRVFGKRAYTSLTHSAMNGNGEAKQAFSNLYCINMETDSVSLVDSFTLPNLTLPIYRESYAVLNSVIYESMGTFHWIFHYEYQRQVVVSDPMRFDTHIVIDGENSNVLTDYSPRPSYTSNTYGTYKYNHRDFIYWEKLITATPGKSRYLTVTNDGVITIRNDATLFPDCPPVCFSHVSNFIKIGIIANAYYYLDSNGKSTSPITLSGVNFIYRIYPTLDTINGYMYVAARMTNGTDRLLSVNPITGAIFQQFDIGAFPYLPTANTQCFNHGNYFINWYFSTWSATQVAYIVDVPPVPSSNEVEMIIEQN